MYRVAGRRSSRALIAAAAWPVIGCSVVVMPRVPLRFVVSLYLFFRVLPDHSVSEQARPTAN